METHEFEEKVSVFISHNDLLRHGERVLVTLSGGADSVTLLMVLRSLGYDCVAVHCNFHLRGEESMRDERFVCSLCSRLDVMCDVRDFDVAAYVAANGVSVEMACRELRYEWFEQMRVAHGCSAIAVAHHSDDNQETFFLNLLRGSGIAGLAGIKPRNGVIVRPLLCVSRADVESYLEQMRQDYVVDSTNSKNDYKRNIIRNVVRPHLRELFPASDTGLQRTLHDIGACNELYQFMLGSLREQVVSRHDDGTVVIPLHKLAEVKVGTETFLYEILKDFGFNSVQVAELYASVVQGRLSGKKIISATHDAYLNRDTIEIMKREMVRAAGECHDVDLSVAFTVEPLNLSVSRRNMTEGLKDVDGKKTIALSLSVVEHRHRVCVRHWQKGDRLRPFGMKGRKLVSDVFADMKLSELQKRSAWLLTVDGEVVWIVGYRASALFAVKSGEKECLIVSVP